MKRSVITLLSVVAILLVSSGASAEESWWPQVQSPPGQVISINFDGDTLGARPSAGAMSPVITQLGYLGDWNTEPATTQFGDFAVANVAGMSKACLSTTDYNGIDSVSGEVYNGYANLWMDTGWVSPNGGTASSRMALNFDFAVMAAPATMTPAEGTTAAANSVFYLAPHEGFNAHWAYRFVAVPTTEGGGIFGLWNSTTDTTTTFGSYVEGQKYNITLAENYSAGTVDAYIDGALALGEYANEYGAVTDPRGGWTRELWMTVNGSDGLQNQVALDNIEMYIPFDGDANMDGTTDATDLNTVLSYYNQTDATWRTGDFNGDGTTDATDLNTVLSYYNQTVFPAAPSLQAAVPEPSSIAMLVGIALTALLCWWRKRA